MTYRGHIKNGVAIPDTPISLPDGTAVRMEVERPDSDSWRNRTVGELAIEQAVQPINGLDDLVVSWPEEDSIDDLLALVREVRR